MAQTQRRLQKTWLLISLVLLIMRGFFFFPQHGLCDWQDPPLRGSLLFSVKRQGNNFDFSPLSNSCSDKHTLRAYPSCYSLQAVRCAVLQEDTSHRDQGEGSASDLRGSGKPALAAQQGLPLLEERCVGHGASKPRGW